MKGLKKCNRWQVISHCGFDLNIFFWKNVCLFLMRLFIFLPLSWALKSDLVRPGHRLCSLWCPVFGLQDGAGLCAVLHTGYVLWTGRAAGCALWLGGIIDWVVCLEKAKCYALQWGRATGWGLLQGRPVGWAPRIPRVSAQAPWLCWPRCYTWQLGMAVGLAPFWAIGWASELPGFSVQASWLDKIRSYTLQLSGARICTSAWTVL